LQKIKRILIFAFLIIFCTSCANVTYQLEINKDGSANLIYLLETDKEKFDEYEDKYENVLKVIENELEQNGFSVNKYEAEEKVKFEAKIYLDDINKLEEFNTLIMAGDINKPIVSYSKNLFFERYEINAKIDLKSYSQTERESKNDEIVSESLPINFVLKLPVTPNSHNASKTEENYLIWELAYNQENIITAKYEIINYIAIVVLALLLFAIAEIITIKIVKVIISKSAQKNNNDINIDETMRK